MLDTDSIVRITYAHKQKYNWFWQQEFRSCNDKDPVISLQEVYRF